MADYQLNNTGQEIQERLDQVPVNEQAIADEVTRATGVEEALSGDVSALQGTVDADVENLAENYYTKQEVEGLIIPHDAPIVVGPLPAEGDTGKIYRVPGTSTYSDYAWNGTEFVLLATHNIDAIWPQIGYYECGTAAGTAAKVVTASGYILATGGNVRVKMTYANTADAVTMELNNTGAKALYCNGRQVSSDNSWNDGDVLTIYYDGEHYVAAPSAGYDEDTEKAIASVFINQHNEHEDNASAIASLLASLATKIGEDEEQVLANALVELFDNSANAGVSGVVNITNSDKIAILGASFSDGSHPSVGKDWTCILSALTDYNYHDFAIAGTNPLRWLDSNIRGGSVVGYRYTLITGYSINQLSAEDAVKVIPIMIDSLESMGVEPILGSPYNGGSGNDSWLRTLAKERNIYYYPCGEYFALTDKARNPSGDGGYHLGTYSCGVWSNGYLIQAPHIDRPMQSMKVFRLRSGSANKTLDELVFHTNEDRFVNFRELYFGQLRGGDEYSNLSSVTFSGKALVSVVLPVDYQDITGLSLRLKTLNNAAVNVYALDTLAAPYPSPSTCARFSVLNEITLPTAGDVYSTNGVVYTVITSILGENGMFCTIYCEPTVTQTGGAGTLTKVSGEGPSTIEYYLVEQASLSVAEYDNDGHWSQLSGSNSEYTVANPRGMVQKDKVHFLISSESAFTITKLELVYSGTKLKNRRKGRIVEFDSNEYNTNAELLGDATFGIVGSTLSSWTDSDDNNVITQAGYVSRYMGQSIVLLSDVLTMSQTVTLGIGRYILEVIARNPQTTVDEESYDFSDMYVDMTLVDSINMTKTWRQKRKVGLYPTIMRYPIEIGASRDVTFKIFATEKTVEVLSVSLKRY